ncbi:Catalase, partial [Orchesella cincta]
MRSRKRNPETGLYDQIMAWDFKQQRPETTHQSLKGFSDINTPESIRSINGSGVHTFKLVDEQGDAVYCKFHFISHQKFELMSNDRQIKLAGSEPSFYRRELYNAIAQQQYPRWTMALQVATLSLGLSRCDEKLATRRLPLIPVGILELNRNVKDFFSESEQSAFSPANLVPGIEPSADRMLHGRMFSYADAQRYRLGINGMMLPSTSHSATCARPMKEMGQAAQTTFQTHSMDQLKILPLLSTFSSNGDVIRADTKDADNFSQPRLFIEKDLTPESRQRLANNLAGSLKKIPPELRELVYRNNIDPVSRDFGTQVRLAVQAALLQPAKTNHYIFVLCILWNILRTGIGDPVSDQLVTWKLQHPNPPPFCTDLNGIHYPNLRASLAIGVDGPPLLQDRSFFERTASFNRERINERVAHALGFGAHGTFTVTHDVSQWTKAKLFNRVGKRTPIFLRFSGTIGEPGYADTYRDSRGFAVKFYTEDGNWDLVGNQIEVFGVRDPFLFGSLIRSRKRNPETGLLDPIMAWDFIQQRPETTHHILKAESSFDNGSGVHTFKLVDEQGDAVYCKFHLSPTKLGVSRRSFAAIFIMLSRNSSTQDGTMALQVATVQQAESYRWDYLDITKNWRLEDFPLIPVGILELNRNVKDFFSESEQSAFSPANLVPGIEPSADRMLHGRMFSYADAQRYRLGINGMMLPINKPLSHVASYERDGAGCPNYFPNSFNGPIEDPSAALLPFQVNGDVIRADTKDVDNFSQPRLFIEKDLTPESRQRLVNNLAGSLKKIPRAEGARKNRILKVMTSYNNLIMGKKSPCFYLLVLPFYWCFFFPHAYVTADPRSPPRVSPASNNGVSQAQSHRYTKAKLFNGVGKTTPCFVRFSTSVVSSEALILQLIHMAFATKFYTEEGNYDLVGNDIEVFPIRDPMLFSDLNRSRKRNPLTHLKDANMWDFVSLRPETSFHTLQLFSDIGRANGYRRMNGSSVHAFRFVNSTGRVFAKFHWRSQQLAASLTFQEAKDLQGTNPDYFIQDLYDSIESGNNPSLAAVYQVMTEEQAQAYPRNPFDITRNWRVEDFPLIEVGRMTLNKNPINYFAEVEQAGFAVSNMPRQKCFMDVSYPTKILSDTVLETNFPQLPINRPVVEVNSYIRDGQSCHGNNGGGSPNYFPNSFGGPEADLGAAHTSFSVGVVDRFDIPEDEFVEARWFLERDITSAGRQRMLESIADKLKDAQPELQTRVLQNNFYPISTEFGDA